MRTLKIVMIYPGRRQIQLSHKKARPWFPPTSLLAVAGATSCEHEISLINELAQGPVNISSIPPADVYAFSFLSTSRYGAYHLADSLRLLGKPLIAGGMDVTGQYYEGDANKLLEKFDSIVVGKLTRKLWARVLDDCEKGKLAPIYLTDIAEPWEFLPLRYDLIKPSDYLFPAVIQTSAGCGERCPFCTVHLIIGSRGKVHTKPLAMIEKELMDLPPSRFLVDYSDSFGGNYLHTREVLPLFLATGKAWFAEITVKNLLGISTHGEERGELITPMAKSGCAVVYIGIESLSGPVSGKSLSIQLTEEATSRCHDAGMMVIGTFMFDVTKSETLESIVRTVDWAMRHLDAVQFSLLALLPGSQMRMEALKKNLIIDNNPEHLDGAWPTRDHPNMTAEQRINALMESYKRFYKTSQIIMRLAHVPLRRWPINLVANFAVNRSIKNWEAKVGGYEHWLRTKE